MKTGMKDKNGADITGNCTISVMCNAWNYHKSKNETYYTDMIVKYVDEYASWCVFVPQNYESWKSGKSNHFKYAYDSDRSGDEVHFLGQLDSSEIEIKTRNQMNNLNNFLLNWEKRVDEEGNEVVKPELKKHDCHPFCDKCTEFLKSKEYQSYAKAATKVIAFPDWKTFWNEVGKLDISDKETIALMDEFWSVCDQKPTIEMFVPWVDGEVMEEPEQPTRDDFEIDETDYFDKAWSDYGSKLSQYRTAQSKIQFFGAILVGRELWYRCRKIATIGFNKEWLFIHDTIDDLNRECQLLKTVK